MIGTTVGLYRLKLSSSILTRRDAFNGSTSKDPGPSIDSNTIPDVSDLFSFWSHRLISKLGNELKFLSAKAQFIQYNLNDKIDLRKKSKTQINEIMESFKFELGEDKSYNYLIKMPMDSVSKENVEKLMINRSLLIIPYTNV